MRKRHPVTEGGHTLLELLVVIAILGLLASIAAPRLSRYAELGKENALKTQLSTVSSALRLFREDVGRFPATTEGLSVLLREPAGLAGWGGPYLASSALRDPWGKDLVYGSPDQSGDFTLFSASKPEWKRHALLTLSRGNTQ
jgi:general secretion pathway protein G